MSVNIRWILSILGFAVTYVFLLGAAMSTVSQKLTLLTALGLAVMPIIVVVGVSLAVVKGNQAIGRNLLCHGIPFLLAVMTLLVLGTSVKPPRWGGPHTDYLEKNTDQLRLREVSEEMLGRHWAILLDGELWLACQMQEPLERELTPAQEF